MNASSSPPPRFLPTLTEVVDPASLVPAPAPETPELEQVVRLVMQRLQAELERRLQEQIQVMLHQQLQILRASICEQMEPLVRQSVVELLHPMAGQETMK